MNGNSSSVPDSGEHGSLPRPQCVENLWRIAGFRKTTLAVGRENIRQQDLEHLHYEYSREFRRGKKIGISKERSTLQALEQLLEYTSTGLLELEGLEDNVILEILSLGHQYGLEKLQRALRLYLIDSLSVFNVCAVSATAKLLQSNELLEVCFRFMDLHASAILRTESFRKMPADVLKQTLSRDSFYADELDIFNAVKRWCKGRVMNEEAMSVLSEIRLPLIELDDLLRTVGPSRLIPVRVFEKAVGSKLGDSNVELKYRGKLVREENVTTADRRAYLMSREPLRMAFRPLRNHPALDWDRRILKHDIQEPFGITIALGDRYILNNIILTLLDRERCSFSYYVEVSANCKIWDRIIDFSERPRRSVQRISFKPRAVGFIRVVGTQSTRFNSLIVTNIKAFYSEHCPKIAEDDDEPFEFMSGANEDFHHQQLNYTKSVGLEISSNHTI